MSNWDKQNIIENHDNWKMLNDEWCNNATILNFCTRYLAEEAQLNNATFDQDSIKVSL